MSPRPEPNWQTYRGSDTLPAAGRELLGDEAAERFEAYDADAARAADDADGDAAAEPVCLAAVDEEGGWLAAVLLLIEQVGDETVASIHQLVVPPAHRGQGLAGRLIRRAIALGREAGATRLRSTAGWGCPDHLAMYDRLRFERLAAREMPYLVSKPLDR